MSSRVPSTSDGLAAASEAVGAITKVLGKAAVVTDAAGTNAGQISSSSSAAAAGSSSTTSTSGPTAAAPSLEYAFGSTLATLQTRARLADKVTSLLSSQARLSPQTAAALGSWLEARHDATACASALAFADVWLARDGAFDQDVKAIYEARATLEKKSHWIVVGDGWGSGSDISGIHHILSSGEDVNLLVLASDPAEDGGSARARRDVGLYALNYGGSYVASCAPTLRPEQFEDALRGADAHHGPSVVLAFIPTKKGEEGTAAATAAVDSGRWPLYRYDPAAEAAGKQSFTVDSAKLRDDIAAFLDRETHLSLLSKAEPELPASLTTSLDASLVARQAEAGERVKESFDRLMGALTLPPLAIYFGSDGGNAENLAKRLGNEARAKGFKEVTVKAMDTLPLETLPTVPLTVFVVSTAGQGEFPMNARTFWKNISAAAAAASPAPAAGGAAALPADAPAAAGASSSAAPGLDLSRVRFAIFGLGDSNYWPKKEQRIFFNKPSIDLDQALGALGGIRLVERGSGDDQEVGGFNAGFKSWLPTLWSSLGVGSPADANADAPRVRGNEDIKRTSNFLRGTILQGLADTSTGALTYEDTQLTKFHGIYQQDDRDIRGERKRRGLEPAYSFMVRVRIPGGVCTPRQYIALDEVADTHANGTVRATTRQAVQFHGIIKGLLKPGIAAINRSLMDTLAACGDVNRNVMCTVNPLDGALHAATLAFSKDLSAQLSPRTSAYHEIWLDEKLVAGGGDDFEPIYGKEYLPRKFKIGVAVPPHNDVDVYTQDLSYIAIADEKGELAGFTVVVGGGMGMTHNNVKTFPRLAEVMGFVTVDKAIAVAEAVITTQRDYGDRTNRKHARLKYTIDDRGIDWFRNEVETRIGFKLEPARPFTFANNADRMGWTRSIDGTWGYTIFIQNGRIKDTDSYRLKTGLRSLANYLTAEGVGDFRFTGNQNLMVAGIPEGAVKAAVEGIFAEHNILNTAMSGLRLNSMACVAFPTCGLALAESERYLPSLVTRLETALEEVGLRDDAITIRMTGCPNGCARPFVAEIGFVGRSPGIYNLYLGAGHHGERLNKLYKEGVDEEAIVAALTPLFGAYAKQRTGPEEHFGDWVVRAGVVKPTISGRTFHDL